MVKGAFRLNTFLTKRGFKALQWSMSNPKATYQKGNIIVKRKASGFGSTYIELYINGIFKRNYDITGGSQKAEIVAQFKNDIETLIK